MTTKAKGTHTPGPWEVRPSSNPKNGSGWRDIVSVGTVYAPSYVGEALEADARLFVAAPQLAEACKLLLADLKVWVFSVDGSDAGFETDPVVVTARAALKAAGIE